MTGTLGRLNLGFFSAFALIATGCLSLGPYDPGPGKRVAATVVQDTYVSGGPVNVTIANLSEVMLFYPDGFCKTELQRKDGKAWIPVAPIARKCPAELGFLDPEQAVVHQFRIPLGIAAGTYRFALPMPRPDETKPAEPELVTPAFEVESAVIAVSSRAN